MWMKWHSICTHPFLGDAGSVWMGMKPSVWRYCLYSCTKLEQSVLCHLSSDGLCSVGDGMPACTVNVSDAEKLPGWWWECWNTELNPKRKQESEYIVGFWVKTPHSVIGGYCGCGWTYFLHLHVSVIRTEQVCLYKMLVSTYQPTWCYNPHNHDGHLQNHENHKSCTGISVVLNVFLLKKCQYSLWKQVIWTAWAMNVCCTVAHLCNIHISSAILTAWYDFIQRLLLWWLYVMHQKTVFRPDFNQILILLALSRKSRRNKILQKSVHRQTYGQIC